MCDIECYDFYSSLVDANNIDRLIFISFVALVTLDFSIDITTSLGDLGQGIDSHEQV